MKSYLLITLAVALLATQARAEDKIVLKDQKQKLSYSIGLSIGSDVSANFKRQAVDLDAATLAAGVADAVAGAKPLLNETEIRAVMEAFQAEMMAKQGDLQKELAASGEKNLKEGQEFLAANAKKEGVKTLPSGLQYKVLHAGTGKSPQATDTVKTHYRGTLINGKKFDSSYAGDAPAAKDEPATFPVNRLIPGWQEALQLMKVGDKWQLFIPARLAYGENGTGPDIGPNTALIFDMELLGIQ